MHLLPEVDCGPKAWTVLKELHALTSVVATLMLERELSALRLSEGRLVQPVLDKMRDLYAKLATAGITYPEQTKCLKMLSLLPESWLQFTSGLSLPQNQSLWMLEWVRTKILDDFCRRQLRGGDDRSSGYGMLGSRRGRSRSFGGAAVPVGVAVRNLDVGASQDGGTRRNQKNGANIVANSFDNNLKSNGGAEKKKERSAGQFFHIGEQGEQGDASAKVGAELHPLDYWVAKAGRAAFKGADGKPVVLHDVLLVPDLKANLISLHKLAKAGGEAGAVSGLRGRHSSLQQQLMKNYIGMDVERDLDHRWLKLHQEKFIKELGEKYGIENERKVATPLPAEFKLVKAAEDEGVEAEEQQQFQSLVGSLLYAAVHTRPDIPFSVGQLARVVQNPSEEQVDAAERVVKYLNSHPSIGVQYSASAQVKQKGVEVLKEKGERLGEGKLFLTCFTDATWASEKDDSSSVGGYICVVRGGRVSWRSKKLTEMALSSVESEYMAMFHGMKELIWLKRLLEEIDQDQKVATPLFCDSKGALGMARNAVLHGLNKHMRIKWHWLRKEVKRGTVNPIYIKTHQQPADLLTKRLADEPHWHCMRMSGISMN
ncbi:unnamed protein product [Closterium sp. NIES-54]